MVQKNLVNIKRTFTPVCTQPFIDKHTPFSDHSQDFKLKMALFNVRSLTNKSFFLSKL
uniref:Uncharacterized protein n=1 Tax=Anguilla anguilla TaxID=7936 RepID=A0A0E9UA50_ANGAN